MALFENFGGEVSASEHQALLGPSDGMHLLRRGAVRIPSRSDLDNDSQALGRQPIRFLR